MLAAHAIVTVYTDFRSAGGQFRGTLVVAGGSVKGRVDGDDLFSVTVTRASWDAATTAGGRAVLCVQWPEGTIEEFRITRDIVTDGDPLVQLDALPVIAELVTQGIVAPVLGVTPQTRITGEFTQAQIIDQFVLPHRAAVRIGLTRGVTDQDAPKFIDADASTPGAVLRLLAATWGNELEIERTSHTAWTAHLRTARGASAKALTLAAGLNIGGRTTTTTDTIASAVQPLGDADPVSKQRATMARVKYKVTAHETTSPGWVTLIDNTTGRGAILTDTQYVGAFLVLPSGLATEIIQSRASDSSVRVNSTVSLSVGVRVGLAATADRQPLLEVFDTASQATRTRRVVPLIINGQRGEAQELADGRFALGLTKWSALNATTPPAFVELTRDQIGVTRSGTVQTSRPAATGTGTPLSIGGLTPLEWVRQQDRIVVTGATITTTGPAVAAADGSIVLPVAALATAIPAGTVVVLTRAIASATVNWDIGAFVGCPNSIGPHQSTYGTPVSMAFEASGVLSAYDTMGDASSGSDRITLTGTFVFTDEFLVQTTVTTLDAYVKARRTSLNGQRVNTQPLGASTAITGAGGYLGAGDYIVLECDCPPGLRLYTVTMSPQTCAVTRRRETRSVAVQTTAAAGATSVTLAPLASVARALPASGSSAALRRDLTAVMDITSAPTALYVQTFDVTIDLGTSTIQSVAPADWPLLVFTLSGVRYSDSDQDGLWDVNGSPTVRVIVTNIVGTTVTLTVVDEYIDDLGASRIFAATVNAPQTGNAAGVAIRTVQLSSAAPAWTANDDYASASWAVTQPSLAANEVWAIGSPLWIDLPGSYSAYDAAMANLRTPYQLHTAYTIVAATTTGTLPVRAYDNTPASSNPTSPLTFPNVGFGSWGGTYRARTGSTFVTPGETMVAAASAQANGSGVASVTLMAANVAAVGAAAPFTITRPSLLRVNDPTTGSVVRLLYSIGGTNQPTNLTPGLGSELVTVPVSAGGTQPVSIYVTVALTAGSYPVGQQPAIAILDAAGAVLNWGRVDDVTVVANGLVHVRLVVTTVLAATGAVRCALYGGFTNQPTLWHVVLDAMLCFSDRDDVPYTDDAHANALASRATDFHAARRLPQPEVATQYVLVRRWTDADPTAPPVVPGQRIVLRDQGLTRRVMSVERMVLEPDTTRIEIGAMADDLSRRVGRLLTEATIG